MSVGDGEYSLRNAQHNKTGRWMLDACKVVDALLLAGPKTVLDLGSCNQLRRWCEAVGYETVRCQTWGGDSIPKMRIEYLGHA
jgi:hypothetical protein